MAAIRKSLGVLGKVSRTSVRSKNLNGSIWISALDVAEQTVMADVSIIFSRCHNSTSS